jgi:hypothetical protein
MRATRLVRECRSAQNATLQRRSLWHAIAGVRFGRPSALALRPMREQVDVAADYRFDPIASKVAANTRSVASQNCCKYLSGAVKTTA